MKKLTTLILMGLVCGSVWGQDYWIGTKNTSSEINRSGNINLNNSGLIKNLSMDGYIGFQRFKYFGGFQANGDVQTGQNYFTYISNGGFHTLNGNKYDFTCENVHVDFNGLTLSRDGFCFLSKYVNTIGSQSVNEIMRLTMDGKLGIGTPNPKGRLDIVGGNGGYLQPTLSLHPEDGASYAWSLISLYGGNADNAEDYMIGRGRSNFYSGRALTLHVPSRSGFYSSTGEMPKIAFVSSGANTLGFAEAETGNWYFKGNVGIGNSDPLSKLHIKSSGEKLSILRLENATWKCNQETAIEFWNGSHHGVATSKIISKMNNCGDGGENLLFQTQSPSSDNPNRTEPTTKLFIRADGEIGIGTTTPSAKLDVAGNIKAHEIEVTLAAMQDLQLNGTLAANNITYTANGNTADFVFEDNYHLKDLSEVEAFIKTNKHLPDIPSAAEMEEAGVNLAKMNKLLLMKVEELTLYSIDLEKEVREVRSNESEVRKEVSSLEMEVEELRDEKREMRMEMEERLAKMEEIIEKLSNR